MSDSWGGLYCILRYTCLYFILRSTCVWQLRVSILYTKEHLCLTVEGIYIVHKGTPVSDSWGYLYCILRNTCVWQLRVSILYTKDHLCLTVEGVYIILSIYLHLCVYNFICVISFTKQKNSVATTAAHKLTHFSYWVLANYESWSFIRYMNRSLCNISKTCMFSLSMVKDKTRCLWIHKIYFFHIYVYTLNNKSFARHEIYKIINR